MSAREPRTWRPNPPPLRWSMPRVLRILLAGWLVALAATLAVPAWHAGDRAWWPVTCVTGFVLGLVGYAYVRRGRGNAADA